MTTRFFNGLQIDVPDGWADVSTVIVAPRKPVQDGKKPGINLVVKRRPMSSDETDRTMQDYLSYMKTTFGSLEDLQSKELMVGSIKGKAVRFTASAEGRSFRQITVLYHTRGEEVSATVTQLLTDETSMTEIERILKSIKPAAGGARGLH